MKNIKKKKIVNKKASQDPVQDVVLPSPAPMRHLINSNDTYPIEQSNESKLSILDIASSAVDV